ncbi:MAG TPA: gluconate 2-dehydrogenase subunit 3 family protein [Bryobacteraceae bacterium]|jgi:hypothetical protein
MKRRRWIQTVLAAPAAAAAAVVTPDEAAETQASPRDEFAKLEIAGSPTGNAEPLHVFFSKSEYAALERLANAILPPLNGKPGALDAQVPAFLDFLLSQSPKPRQILYREGLARIGSGQPIEQLLKPLSAPWTYHAPLDPFAKFLREAKQDILEATFNSREWIDARADRRGGAGTYYLAVD